MCFYVVIRCFFGSITWVLGATGLLVSGKLSYGVRLIVVDEISYQLVNGTLYI